MPRGNRRLPDDARGDLDVLLAKRLDDVAGGDVAGRQPRGIEPDAHAVLAQAEEVDVADAFDAPQRIAHLDEREVADVELVVAVVRREQMHDHQQVGRRLESGDAEAPDILGEARHGDRHAVLHEDLCRVEVGAEPEGDRQRHLAVGRGLRRHVEHVFDAVDLLLDRRRDGVGDDLRRRARVRGLYDDRRRHDVGILRDR